MSSLIIKSGLINLKCLFLIVFVQCTILSQQNSIYSVEPNKEQYKIIPLKDIFLSDKEGIIDRDFYSLTDSINTCFWKNNYWLKLKLENKEWDENRAVELFVYNDSAKFIKQITNHDLYWTNTYGGSTEDIFIFYNQMYTIKYGTYNDSIIIIAIDPLKFTILKETSLSKSARITKNYINNNKLYFELQPYKRKLNIGHYLLFWLPRGKDPKWDYVDDGNKWLYVLDEEFVIVKEEEIKRK